MQIGRVLWKVVDGLLFLQVSGMLVIVTIQIVGRLIGRSVPWSEEMTRNFFVWAVNCGMAAGFRYAEHARVTFALKILPGWLKRFQIVLYVVSCAAFFAIVCVLGYGITTRQFRSGEMAPATGIPMFLVTLPIVLCSLLALIGTIQSAFFDAKTRQIIAEEEAAQAGGQ
jgi:TRAP-type C4-dicarboxylate transport system permease small subunit